jgi:glutaminase
MKPIHEVIQEVYAAMRARKMTGKNASYIPDLATVDPNLYAISVCTVRGETENCGDCTAEVGIESVSKVFTLALALNRHGIAGVFDKIGSSMERHAFNSTSDVVHTRNHTVNAFVNAGAMATTSLLYNPAETHKQNETRMRAEMLDNMSRFAGRKLKVNKSLYLSEYTHSDHNAALIAALMRYRRFYGDAETTLKTYTAQCSVMVTSKDVAVMAATLAAGGKNPITGQRLLSPQKTAYVVRHISEHGLYNESQQWWAKTHLPAKSGVGGVIMIVIPGVMGIGIVSPPLNKYGNSARGIKTGELLGLALRDAGFMP